jgi:hypothetical protein
MLQARTILEGVHGEEIVLIIDEAHNIQVSTQAVGCGAQWVLRASSTCAFACTYKGCVSIAPWHISSPIPSHHAVLVH